MLDQVHERVLDRRLVQRRHVPQVHQPEPQRDPGPGAGQRAQRALDPHQPARDRAQDHARERQQQQHRRDVAQQHVLEHVRGEQVVLAERVERAGQRQPAAPGSRPRTPPPERARRRGRPPRAAPGGSAARRSPPASRSAAARTGRAATGSRVTPRTCSSRTRLSQCRLVPSHPRREPRAHRLPRVRALSLVVPPFCWECGREARSGRAAVPAVPARAALARSRAGGRWRGSACGRRWPTRARRGRSCAR